MNEYHIKLDVFQGPFDLLLHLIHKHRIDIYDIPIAKIADEFVDYLQQAEFVDVEQAADFLVMAATLMQIKARMLVPRPRTDAEADEEEDPRSELVERLIEYRALKEAASALRERSEYWSHVFAREVDEIVRGSDEHVSHVGDVTASALAKAFLAALARASENGIADEPTVIARDRVTVLSEIRRLRRLLREQGSVSFLALFGPAPPRERVVTTFLAMLELIRQGGIAVKQSVPFGDILLVFAMRRGGRAREH
jgi:segregation and condensation protein A